MLFGTRKSGLVTAEEALPGRDTPVRVPARHTVKGAPLVGPWPEGHEVLYVAMGCFWGAERIFWRLDGVHTTAVGYMGGHTPNPTYEETCTARTGHTETAMVVYDPAVVDLERLFKEFWENHDPTTPNRQGNDVGTQYRSAVFTTTDAQLAAARRLPGALPAGADRGRLRPDQHRDPVRRPTRARSTTPRTTTSSTWPRTPAGTATTASARSATTWPRTARTPRRRRCPRPEPARTGARPDLGRGGLLRVVRRRTDAPWFVFLVVGCGVAVGDVSRRVMQRSRPAPQDRPSA